MRILLVEDESDLSELISSELGRRGFLVDVARSLEEAEEATSSFVHNVIILDRQLGDGDGLDLIPQLRKRQLMMPIIVLSALGTPGERVTGLQQGADDYLAKPFMMDELVARIRSLLRRPQAVAFAKVNVGNLEFDFETSSAIIDGKPFPLSRRETLLLQALVRKAGRTVRRNELFNEVYGYSDDIGSNSLDAHISRMRRKLTEAGAFLEIHPIRGVGYLIKATSEVGGDD